MACKWLGERVAAPDLNTVIKNALTKTSAGNWGPNATFKFPAHGGTGGIWKSVAAKLQQDKLRFGEDYGIEEIDTEKKYVVLKGGKRIGYESLVSTLSVDHLLPMLRVEEAQRKEKIQVMTKSVEKGLVYSNTIVLGLGIRGVLPPRIGDKCE